jgi:DNA-binding transcriptional ArsR family regulator
MSPIDLEEDPIRKRLELMIAPVAEMFNSLHVLADPSHHLSNQEWAQGAFASMPLDLREEVAYFGRNFDEWLGIADIPHLVNPTGISISAFLKKVADLPPEQVVNIALHGAGQSELPEYQQTEPSDPGILAARSAATENPTGFVTRLINVLQRYWIEVFAAEWERRRPLVEQRRTLEAAHLDHMAPVEWLTTLHNRISYEQQNETLVFHKSQDLRFQLHDLERILCIPSSFTAPHLMVGYARKELTIYINVPLTIVTPERVPSGLLLVAQALSDETRLRIFRSVLRRPHYTQELAVAMKLSEPTVSRHLKILKAAKLVYSHKERTVVLYSGTLEPVDQFPALMREFLRG